MQRLPTSTENFNPCRQTDALYASIIYSESLRKHIRPMTGVGPGPGLILVFIR